MTDILFKAIPVEERLPEVGKWVTTIDSEGEHRVYRLTEDQHWNMRDAQAVNSPPNNLKITHWLEKMDEKGIAKTKKVWDNYFKLRDEVEAFYFDKEGNPIDSDELGDLSDIGEVCARHFGLL